MVLEEVLRPQTQQLEYFFSWLFLFLLVTCFYVSLVFEDLTIVIISGTLIISYSCSYEGVIRDSGLNWNFFSLLGDDTENGLFDTYESTDYVGLPRALNLRFICSLTNLCLSLIAKGLSTLFSSKSKLSMCLTPGYAYMLETYHYTKILFTILHDFFTSRISKIRNWWLH